MKPTEFLQEFTDAPSDGTDATMAKNTLHTIVRVASHLEGALSDNEHLPEWVEEKLGAIKEMMVTVMDYALSQHEMDKEHEDGLPAFNIGNAEQTVNEMLDDEDEAERKIQHLMQKYHWSRQEAMEHYYYGEHDPSDWEGIEEGYNPVESDWHNWSKALYPHGDGAHALELVGRDADTVRNILTYVKQNRQVLGQEVGDRTNKTVKDAIIDIRKAYPELYQSAQQPQGMAEGQRWADEKTSLSYPNRKRIEVDPKASKHFGPLATRLDGPKYNIPQKPVNKSKAPGEIPNFLKKGVEEHIVKVKGGYELKSKHGDKNLGKYPTRAGAEKRERQVQYFKHAGESVNETKSLRQQLKQELNRLSEDSGATVSSSVATVVTELGAGGMTKAQVQKRLQGYSNRQSNVKHDIKPPKAKK